MRKKLVLYFDRMEDFHLNKDVGIVPLVLSERFDLELEYITGAKCNAKEFHGRKIKKIKRFPNHRYNLFFYLFLFFNAKKIDFLMTFHSLPYSLFIAKLYKYFNKKGKVYIKCDLGPVHQIHDENEKRKKALLKMPWLKRKYKEFRINCYLKRYKNYKYVDLFSVENKSMYYEFLEKGFYGYDISDKLTHLQNGIYLDYNDDDMKFSEKKNLFINVARIGAEVKNTKLILEVLKKIKLKNWCFYFIGRIEDSFIKEIKSFYSKNPQLKENVRFLGSVENRKELFEYYKKAKVFCLSSVRESWGLVLSEARYFGNYIISTNVGGALELIKTKQFGKIVEQNLTKEFSETMQAIIDGKINLEESYEAIIKCRNEVNWNHLIGKNKKINELFM